MVSKLVNLCYNFNEALYISIRYVSFLCFYFSLADIIIAYKCSIRKDDSCAPSVRRAPQMANSIILGA